MKLSETIELIGLLLRIGKYLVVFQRIAERCGTFNPIETLVTSYCFWQLPISVGIQREVAHCFISYKQVGASEMTLGTTVADQDQINMLNYK